jgi:hypothetical protein
MVPFDHFVRFTLSVLPGPRRRIKFCEQLEEGELFLRCGKDDLEYRTVTT